MSPQGWVRGTDPQRLHEERMRRLAEEQWEHERVLKALADQIRLLRAARGLPPDLVGAP